MRRPKIYVLFCKQGTISHRGGDTINEMRLYRSLSTFADVYYNDDLIDFDKNIYGKSENIKPPSRKYDLYYVRNNPEFFLQLPSPKITLAYPYNETVFRNADGLFVTNASWISFLRSHESSPASKQMLSNFYPDKIFVPNTIINVEQSNEQAFEEKYSEKKMFEYKVKTLGARIVGLYGRITDKTFQQDVYEKVRKLNQNTKTPCNPILGLAGSIRIPIPQDILSLGHVDYQDMPYLYKNTYIAFGAYTNETNYLGSTKLLDAMQQGTPILQRRTVAREEQLGSNYGGFYDDSRGLEEIVDKMFFEEGFRDTLSQELLARSTMFDNINVGNRIQSRLLEEGIM